jgi:acyl-lipid omega-6 desaturase (Delta-12 desaturase)
VKTVPHVTPPPAASPDAKGWALRLSRYRKPDDARGAMEIMITIVPFVVLWAAMAAGLHFGYWAVLLLAIPAGGLLVRLFAIQHDCGHGAFFRGQSANDWTGRCIGVLTLTPYDFWKRVHAMHHAGSGSLDRRGFGDIKTLTVGEYRRMSSWRRLGYRLYRNPFVLFGIGPVYLFLVEQRLPMSLMRAGWRPWASTMGTNLAILFIALAVIWLVGIKAFLLIQLPVVVIAGAVGIWLFFVQHQFEGTTWKSGQDWNWHEAAFRGSSHYDLPGWLRWFTANLGVHHVHHLCSRIPFYRLSNVLRDYPELREVGRLTIRQSIGCVRFALWDEQQHGLISFRDERAGRTMAAHAG